MCLHSNFQRLVFSARREIGGTELHTHTKKHTTTTVCLWGSVHRDIITFHAFLIDITLHQYHVNHGKKFLSISLDHFLGNYWKQSMHTQGGSRWWEMSSTVAAETITAFCHLHSMYRLPVQVVTDSQYKLSQTMVHN